MQYKPPKVSLFVTHFFGTSRKVDSEFIFTLHDPEVDFHDLPQYWYEEKIIVDHMP